MSEDYEKGLSPSRAAHETDAAPGKEQEEARVELMEQKREPEARAGTETGRICSYLRRSLDLPICGTEFKIISSRSQGEKALANIWVTIQIRWIPIPVFHLFINHPKIPPIMRVSLTLLQADIPSHRAISGPGDSCTVSNAI